MLLDALGEGSLEGDLVANGLPLDEALAKGLPFAEANGFLLTKENGLLLLDFGLGPTPRDAGAGEERLAGDGLDDVGRLRFPLVDAGDISSRADGGGEKDVFT